VRNAWGVTHWPSYISRLDLEQACMARSACHRVAEGSAQVHRASAPPAGAPSPRPPRAYMPIDPKTPILAIDWTTRTSTLFARPNGQRPDPHLSSIILSCGGCAACLVNAWALAGRQSRPPAARRRRFAFG
jgi:hypothetical protein